MCQDTSFKLVFDVGDLYQEHHTKLGRSLGRVHVKIQEDLRWDDDKRGIEILVGIRRFLNRRMGLQHLNFALGEQYASI